eukprot:15303249-Heterocapsa_arctica.AAC.1
MGHLENGVNKGWQVPLRTKSHSALKGSLLSKPASAPALHKAGTFNLEVLLEDQAEFSFIMLGSGWNR